MRSDADQHAGEQLAQKKCSGDAEYAACSDEACGLRNDEAEQAAAGMRRGQGGCPSPASAARAE